MEKEELQALIEQEIKNNLSLHAFEKNGVYWTDKYVKIELRWGDVVIDYITIDLPTQE